MKKNNKRGEKNSASKQNPAPTSAADKTSNDTNEDEPISKSALKREMHRLQDLGKQLLTLRHDDLNTLTLSDTLLNALAEAKRIKHREGLRRQMQFIGKLMRAESDETIALIDAYFDRLANQHRIHTQQQHKIEQWRDRILGDHGEIESFLQHYPNADRQWLRQTTRQSAQETQHKKPPISARKLFAYIRDIMADAL